jgi:hypothetical protein
MTDDPSTAYELIEMIRRKAPEYLDLLTAVTDPDFDHAFDALLEKAIAHLEKNKSNFRSLNEVGLTGVLVGALSSPGLSVSQETHSNGHVDLTIEADHCTPARRKLGEAKIYDGPAYHIKGLEQLLGRYITGREGGGLLIVYVRQRNIAGLIAEIREAMDTKLPLEQKGETADHRLQWSFRSMHGNSSGEEIQVGHVGCNLYTG